MGRIWAKVQSYKTLDYSTEHLVPTCALILVCTQCESANQNKTTNLFSRDLLFTTVLALHGKFLANLIMCLKWIRGEAETVTLNKFHRSVASFFFRNSFEQHHTKAS